MTRHRRQQLLDVLFATGLYLLQRGRKRVADGISNTGQSIQDRFKPPRHLRWMLVGVAVGVGVGMLLAPVTGS